MNVAVKFKCTDLHIVNEDGRFIFLSSARTAKSTISFSVQQAYSISPKLSKITRSSLLDALEIVGRRNIVERKMSMMNIPTHPGEYI